MSLHRCSNHTPPYISLSKMHMLFWTRVGRGVGISRRGHTGTFTQAQANGNDHLQASTCFFFSYSLEILE